MDVEKAIHFLLEQQAQINAQQDETARGLNSLRKLVLVGMKMLVKTDAQLKALVQAQKRTEARLDRTDARFERLMAALLQKRTNGRG
ncbi:MAG: hypothetical protein HY238_06500 [Acidobacteria bacterium]|nr:hypothetical protein [Acidobacteriota bacterium]